MKSSGHYIGFVEVRGKKVDILADTDRFNLVIPDIPGRPRNAQQLIDVCNTHGFHYEIHHRQTVDALAAKGVTIPTVNLGKNLQ